MKFQTVLSFLNREISRFGEDQDKNTYQHPSAVSSRSTNGKDVMYHRSHQPKL